ncbi:molybdopterin molybdotransferase MoeA [Polaribacter undariae]|uniref:Molybdopterin molybdenumtransferase n=2 Tax=Polaribacter sejongensis TaxID=985043 RepID=A0AAJ1R1N5_9FLAO|nr:molybdopterin molybdotransferase MoeA [Polaribacter undariae]MDN3621031.1 molybdopterin molybdotransferase MoeA [Polaribacter undariae]UWD31163.1 molybdopterin molybdotransferase MoeA [Polaribacter undariae]
MISVEEALQTVLNSYQDFGVEEIPFIKSVGRILKEEIFADRDFPPFNRVSMDGIAIDYSAFTSRLRSKRPLSFKIEGIQAAGSEQITLKNTENCIEVMTGAVLPNNANTVIRYEDVTIENGVATINIDAINDGQNVHSKGKDGQKGDVLIEENKIISAAEIGVLATVGKSTVKVAKQSKVMIVSTGDELVGVDEIPLEHQIRRSNVFTLVSLLERLNIPSETAHITDDKPILKSKIENYLQEYDVLLFSGAVSKGKYDFLPEVFDELGVEKLFHKVAQRPGKPFWFGRKSFLNENDLNSDNQTNDKYKKNTIVFGFPGNPISTFVNCVAYFYPWYYKSVDIKAETETAILNADVSFKPNLTYFLQVKLSSRFGHLIATPIIGNGSGDLASLVKTDAFIQLPNDKTEFKKGEVFPIIRYR